jgi:anthranilate synthase component 1
MTAELERKTRFTTRTGQDQLFLLSNGRQALVRELPADLETPLSIYLKLSDDSPSFLLESVTGGEQVARY